ncbi:hypothetical protein [Streptomyces sp. NPDC014727]|uniref:hypothetical protein n=1 Tax=Streptomyces sp. NPDC014727 TaxID=3364883 RepID=UPI0036F6A373
MAGRPDSFQLVLTAIELVLPPVYFWLADADERAASKTCRTLCPGHRTGRRSRFTLPATTRRYRNAATANRRLPPAPPAACRTGPIPSPRRAAWPGSRFTDSPIRSVILRTRQNPRSRVV